MLTAEQTSVVRLQIAQVLNVDHDSVVPTARLFADLGATGEHLKPLRVEIEAAMSVPIEPIINEVNARTAVDQNGLLTNESKAQIVAFLGPWPGVPMTKVSFPDLFTVGMIEAIAAKALSRVPAPVVVDDGPPQLSPGTKRRCVGPSTNCPALRCWKPTLQTGPIWHFAPSSHVMNSGCSG